MNEPNYLSPAVSRKLLLVWCAWLLASWTLNLALDTPGRAWVMDFDGQMTWKIPADAFVQVVRGMFQSVMIGMGLAWPLWRLSEPAEERAGRQTAVDWAAMWLVGQVVVLPMRVLIEWDARRLVLLDLTLLVWGGAAALCVWLGQRSRRPARAMAGCAAIMFGGWIVAYLTGWTGASHFSPLHMLWTLCDEGMSGEEALPTRLGLVAAVTVCAWAVMRLRAARGGSTETL